ncbi:Lrp/AsnC family transcriptional regulator [Tersicoccus solisilvae]|nr:Lrp/AsnC family transcriptional regulator [Tersicoccus solisilvae]
MDRTDRAIIDILRSDGRISNVALADRVGLTPGPCLRRVQRLEEDGVILGYRADIDPAAVDEGFEVILDVALHQFDLATVDHFEQTVERMHEVLELFRLFGSPDYFLRVAVADLAAYEAFVRNEIMTIAGIQTVTSRFPMKVIKSLRRVP